MRLRFASVLLLSLVGAIAAASCNGESEGMPCDPKAGNIGNDDCQSPLTCKNLGALGNRCCPPMGQAPTTPECAGGTSLSDASPAPPDSAAAETASTTSDASPDAPAEGGASTDSADGAAD
jgi:hypothetical protein